MRWLFQNWTLFSILLLTFSAGWIVFTAPPPGTVTGGLAPAPQEGFLAPDFALPDANNRETRLSELRGQPVLVNLWASWCAPCKAEMPAMQRVYEEYSAQGFTILAVNTTYQDDAARAQAFAESLGLAFPILFDHTGEVGQAYQVRAMPTSFFVDRQGVVRRVVIGGPMPEALLRAEVERLLAEEP